MGGDITHTYKEANRAADWLANFEVNSEQNSVIFVAVLIDLQTVLLEDMGGLDEV